MITGSIHQEYIAVKNIYEPISTPKIYGTNADRIEEKKKQFYNNGWRLQYPTFNNG